MIRNAHLFSMLAVVAATMLICGALNAQTVNDPPTVPIEMQLEWEKNNPHSLPHWITPEEMGRLDQIGKGGHRTFTAAPPGPPRQAGEFEPMEGVLIRYQFGIPYTLIKEMAEDVNLVTICKSSQQSTVNNNYISQGVNMANVSYLLATTDSYWTRDYGPWHIINGNGDAGIVDTVYNRPRPNDDAIPPKLAVQMGIPSYDLDIITAGGNYMCNGLGHAVSTDLTWSENSSKTHAQIDQLVLDYLGVDNYMVRPDALGEYIKHIDCWAKFLAPDKIMILQTPTSSSNHQALENAAVWFANQNSSYGRPYRVYRVYTTGSQAYINSLILNDKVIITKHNSSWDDDAVQSYQDAMPGYEILSFTGSWYNTDAIHCRTMGITDRYMLYLHHVPLYHATPTAGGFKVEAEIIAYSGGSFTGGTPTLHWKTTGGFNPVAMTNTGGDTYEAYIPWQAHGTEVAYYINAQDSSGRNENHPYIGAPDAHTFTTHNPTLGVSADTLSERDGGVIDLTINAGAGQAGRTYYILGSISGTTPGVPLPGGTVTLPLNWDMFTEITISQMNGPVFQNFTGSLDGNGLATATLDSGGPLPTGLVGVVLYFAQMTEWPFNYVSEAAQIEIVN